MMELHRLCEPSDEGRHIASPSARNPRLILPCAALGRRAGLRFFRPGILSRAKLQIGSWSSFSSKVKVARELSVPLGVDYEAMEFVTLSIGTPGPYQKVTILHSDWRWSPLFVSKLGFTPAARALVANEAVALERLGSVNSLKSSIPELLRKHEGANALCIRQSLGVGRQWGALNPSRPIIELLRALGRDTEILCKLGDANIYCLLQERIQRLVGRVSPLWSERIARVQTWLHPRAHLQGRFVRAHRDFVHWNIKSVGGRPFVYDWEYSEEGYPDGYDALHFMLMPLASRGVMSNAAVGSAKAVAEMVINGLESELDISTQLVLYAIDVCTFYLSSNDGQDEGDVVVRVLGELIDRECAGVTS